MHVLSDLNSMGYRQESFENFGGGKQELQPQVQAKLLGHENLVRRSHLRMFALDEKDCWQLSALLCGSVMYT